jgi:hypothetical protein
MYDRASIAVASGERAALPAAQQNTTPSRSGSPENSARARACGECAFHGKELESGTFDQQIHLEVVVGSKIVDRGRSPAVAEDLDAFRNAEALEERPRHRTLEKMLFRLDSGEPCDQPRVREIQLWGLGDPLAEVSIVRRQEEKELTGLENGYPSLHSGHGDTDVARHDAHVDLLAATGREQPQHTLEVSQAPDIVERAHVPLEVGLEVG